jgi:hypothetical protein
MAESWWSIALDPNHIIAELLWTIAFDFIVVAFLYNVVFKRYVLPKMRKQIHDEIDAEHGVTHDLPTQTKE